MARADLLIKLIKAGSSGDDLGFSKAAEAIAAEERAKKHHGLADRLIAQLQNSKDNKQHSLFRERTDKIEKISGLYHEITPRIELNDLVLSPHVRNVIDEILEEQHRSDILRSYNLEPRHRILFAGPPGNGKTSLAEAIASQLFVPLIQVRYEGVIGSFLGETSQRLKQLFDYARNRRCVLFFDEFDAISKERGDTHDTGEIKRVVSSLLMQIDELPEHVVVIVASNHPELLDRAVWRRFQIRVELSNPTQAAAENYLKEYFSKTILSGSVNCRKIALTLKGVSFSELELFAEDVLRRHVLSLPDSNSSKIIESRLSDWRKRYKT